MKRRRVRIRVTDHAVIRYLERGMGINVAVLRAHIAGLAENGAELGAVGMKLDGFKIVMVDENAPDIEGAQRVVIPTVLDASMMGDLRGMMRHRMKLAAKRKRPRHG